MDFMTALWMTKWGVLCCLGGLAIGGMAFKTPPQDAMFFGPIGLILVGGGVFLLWRVVVELRKGRGPRL